MRDSEQWQLHGSAPLMYERYLVPSITSLWAVDLVHRALPSAGERVLDLACGTGVVARLAAERMGSGQVVGVDINAGMLAIARSLPAPAMPVIEWLEGSALALPLPSASFDLILCQLGLQFFPNRPSAMDEMWRVLVPHGRVAVSVYSSIENTPATHALANALDRYVGPGASRTKRCEHDLSNPDELRELLGAAGFTEIRLETVTQTIRFLSAREYVRLQLLATPLAQLTRRMDAKERKALLAAVTADLVESLQLQSAGAELIYPQEAYVALGTK